MAGASVRAQDLYDTAVLRTISLTFHDADWWPLLQQNYASQTNILADLEMEGVVHPDVGVRIRGNTSYLALPSGSQKVSFNIEMDFVDPDQDLLGYKSLNLNNGFHDPTFCREVVYNNFVAKYMPNSLANHVLLTINGENWGVYINVQQYNKALLRRYFADEDGLRIKCANNPNGPGLRYNGPDPSGYTGYEIKDDGGLADPWQALIAVCNVVTNEPLTTWENIDALFAIDPSIWSVVLENLLTDDDSYVNKGADFMLYRDPVDGRMHLHQTDANETFTQATWSPTRNFTAASKPVLSHVLAVPELRQRYMAHMRTAMSELNWASFGPEFAAMRDRIDAAVQADPKKLYTYAQFLANFTATVTLPGGPPFGGPLIGLQPFITQREAHLGTVAELMARGPTITLAQASIQSPGPGEQVWITALVTPAGSPVAKVELFYRPSPGPYQRSPMSDDGLSGDGAAGDGTYGVLLPVAGVPGQRVDWYVAATSANAYASLSFWPVFTENGPQTLEYSFGQSGIRITEFMYQGANGEFVELTNISDDPIDLAGWSMDDDSGTPGTLSLSGAGVLVPGASVLITDADPAAFAAAWGLSGVPIVGPNTVAALGRNDEIHIYDAKGGLVDRLRYGDQTYPGTIRTQGASGQICRQGIGQDRITHWVLSSAGDPFNSWTSSGGDRGSPGTFAEISCGADCPADLDGDGFVDFSDLVRLLSAWGGTGGSADLDGSGAVGAGDLLILLASWGTCGG
ncbi:MAG: CotH kinase family protein [Phycisphaeraceae bacterium]|nr:CotH kinase family protein [Phycisphaeraceae bacterium]